MKKIIILGAGPSGLGAGWQVSQKIDCQISVYDKHHSAGGVCGYHSFQGLKLDYGPHKIYSILPNMMDVFRSLEGLNLLKVTRRHKIILRKAFLAYPVSLKQILGLFSLGETIQLGLSVLATMLTAPFAPQPITYEDYCSNLFGKKLYELVFKPLAQKVWGEPHTLSADIARMRIPTKNIYDLLLRSLGCKKESHMTDASTILYPKNCFYDICDCLAQQIQKKGHAIYLNRKPLRFIMNQNRIRAIVFDDHSEQPCDLVLSSIPLRELTNLLFPYDANLNQDHNFIRMRNCIIVYLVVKRPSVLDEHWIFCADKDIVFSRFAEQKLLSCTQFPQNQTVISCDFSCDDNDPLWKEDGTVIAQRCIDGLEKLRLLQASDVQGHSVARIPHFYPRYEPDYQKRLALAFDRINTVDNIISFGRLGMSNYNNIDHCLDMGMFIAQALASNKAPAKINEELLLRSYSYRIVD